MSDSSGELKQGLLRPEAYGALRPDRVDLAETHISWVFLLGRDVFKVKKPVDLGFLDFRSIERRKAACDAEVRLNARLAPDVYRGVVPVRRAPGGGLRVGAEGAGGQGEVVDWAVHMTRLPDERRADVLLARGELDPRSIDAVAARVAAFHAGAPPEAGGSAFGSADTVTRNVEENFAQTRSVLDRYIDPEQADEVVRWQTAFVRSRRDLFEHRLAAGRVRDGHGDLRLEHVYLEPGRPPIVIDCVEFSERFRIADVCADVAFLSMDLASHRRVDLAERLLAAYAREADDVDLYALADFYESYRAFIRGKVAAIVASDEGLDGPTRARAEADARRFFLLALSADRGPLLRPVLVAVGGVIGAGKSTIAEQVGRALCAPVLEADRTRKAMLGVPALEPLRQAAWSGAYDAATTERVYAELLRRADVVLASGRPVVLDASFRSRALRRAVRDLAARRGVAFRFVECRADLALTKARLAARERQPGVSDGRLAIFDEFVARFEPVDDVPPDEHVVLDTSLPLEENLSRVGARIDAWPAAFAG